MNRHHRGSLLAAMAIAVAASATVATAATAATATLGRHLAAVLETSATTTGVKPAVEPTVAVWVRFTDKNVTGSEREAARKAARASLSAAARLRREHRGAGPMADALIDDADLPLATAYLDGVAATGMRPRRQSKWLNAASFEATRAQIEAAAALPYVAEIELVRQSGPGTGRPLRPLTDLERAPDKSGDAFAYGPGRAQLAIINVPPAHAAGWTGAGVVIAIFDTGFDLRHDCFDDTAVGATWNFLNGTPEVGPSAGEDSYQLLHGTAALSLMAARAPGVMMGSAPDATYLLAKTEDVTSETPAEEDNWIAALEWAEGLGADIVSSSVGYYYWYDFSELDGVTTMITAAAELAASRGVCVVNSVGNERNNPEWPHLIPPADGRHVIAVGAVSREGLLAAFSSPGPTADGRRKPDVMGQGVDLLAALGGTGHYYALGSGVDYAVPVVAGAVALMLERSPGLSPGQVMTALHATATRAASPDNDYGWGRADVMAAIDYGRPVITHTQLGDREGTGGYPVNATIASTTGLAPGTPFLSWRRDGGGWQLLPMSAQGGTLYQGVIPAQTGSGTIEYYLFAEDLSGRTALLPTRGAESPFSFDFGPDLQAPVVTHSGLADQVLANWPPLLMVDAADNVGIASVAMETFVDGVWLGANDLFPVGDHWERTFPLVAGDLQPGLEIAYRFRVTDLAAVPNTTTSALYKFHVVASRGNVLLIDERNGSKSAASSARGSPVSADADKSIADIAGWLVGAGFQVTTKTGGATQAADFIGRDFVFVTAGVNPTPLANPEMRDALSNYALAGGRVLIEGGEVGYICVEQPGYPDLAQNVLNASQYVGEESPTLWPSTDYASHPFLKRPNPLGAALPVADTGDWYGAADVMQPEPDALAVMHPPAGSAVGGIIVHDDNTCPEAGQTVYFAFDLGRLAAADARRLVENAATWLTYREPAGPSSIIGRVFLPGTMDFSSLTVRTRSGLTGVVGPDGTYRISGLWGGHHVVTVSAPGYGTQTQETNLTDGQQTALNFTLQPVIQVSGSAAPGLTIPDNNAAGIESTIGIASGLVVQGVEVEVEIAHFSIGQLVVQLVSPNGTTVTLHDRTGGVSDNIIGTWPTTLIVDGPGILENFNGVDPVGDWTLRVSDLQFGATGSLISWGLRLLVTGDTASDVGDGLPRVTGLVGNAPNPFNPRTTIAFELGMPGAVRLDVYDARGRLVRHLVDDAYPSGRREAVWDGTDDTGAPVASGIYFSRLEANGTSDVGKMMLLK